MKTGSIVFSPQVPRETKPRPGKSLARVTEEDIKNLKRLKFFLANPSRITWIKDRAIYPLCENGNKSVWAALLTTGLYSFPSWQEAVDAAMKGKI